MEQDKHQQTGSGKGRTGAISKHGATGSEDEQVGRFLIGFEDGVPINVTLQEPLQPDRTEPGMSYMGAGSFDLSIGNRFAATPNHTGVGTTAGRTADQNFSINDIYIEDGLNEQEDFLNPCGGYERKVEPYGTVGAPGGLQEMGFVRRMLTVSW